MLYAVCVSQLLWTGWIIVRAQNRFSTESQTRSSPYTAFFHPLPQPQALQQSIGLRIDRHTQQPKASRIPCPPKPPRSSHRKPYILLLTPFTHRKPPASLAFRRPDRTWCFARNAAPGKHPHPRRTRRNLRSDHDHGPVATLSQDRHVGIDLAFLAVLQSILPVTIDHIHARQLPLHCRCAALSLPCAGGSRA